MDKRIQEKQILFTGTSQEEFKTDIMKDFRHELEILKKMFQPKEPEKYMTREMVKNELHIDYSSINNWKNKGILKAYSICGRVYYKRSEVEAALKPLK